jgi:hypothetical protein
MADRTRTADTPRLAAQGRVVPLEGYHFGPSAVAARPGDRRLKVLVLCHVPLRGANTVLDHCASFRRFSRHDYFYCNPVGKPQPSWMRLDDFDAILVHYSILAVARPYLLPSWVEAIRRAKALKMVFLQDEYRRVNERIEGVQALGTDVLFTCVPFAEVPKVYPASALPRTKIFCTLTGFVPDDLGSAAPDFDRPRPVDVGYRARTLPFWYGALGQEKGLIARRFLELAAGTGLACDISAREEDRIYGKAWVRFLRSCRCTLGTESGASVFDFTGEIERRTVQHLAAHPEAAFEEIRRRFFQDEEGKVRLNQISPRVFEAIACGVCLVLFEGEYSGIIRPGEHFIPLRKDFSNFEEAVRGIRDPACTTAMARRAYQDVVANGQYSYRQFAAGFDRALEMAFGNRSASVATAPRRVSVPLAPGPSKRLSCLVRIRDWSARKLADWQPLYFKDRFRLPLFALRRRNH